MRKKPSTMKTRLLTSANAAPMPKVAALMASAPTRTASVVSMENVVIRLALKVMPTRLNIMLNTSLNIRLSTTVNTRPNATRKSANAAPQRTNAALMVNAQTRTVNVV